jgi:acyl dehydratase
LSSYVRHVRHQVPVIAGLAETALSALAQKVPVLGGRASLIVPGPEIRRTVLPRPAALIRDYAAHVGGDPKRYRSAVPPHLFPQWSFAVAGKTLRSLPYPLARALNGGFRLEIREPMPAAEPILMAARLESIDDTERRVVLRQRVQSGTSSAPEAQVAYLDVIIPRGRGGGSREPPRVPEGVALLETWSLFEADGLHFAQLTGDFNPVHWLRPYARAFGFRSTILHGFSTGARAMEGLARARFAGDVHALQTFEARFTRPLALPAEVGLYADENRGIFVGDGPGKTAYLVGRYQPR